MNRNTVKEILSDYRPGQSQPSPEIEAALAWTERDPELKAWFLEQQRWHAAVRDQLRSIEVPPQLKQRILAQPKIVRPWWPLPGWAWAAAATLILLLVFAFWPRPAEEELSFAAFRGRMVGFALREYRMDILTNDLQVIRDYLASQGGPADYVLPSALESAPPMGGAKLSWQGRPVSMICFQLGPREILYLFVLNEEALETNDVPSAEVEFAQVKKLTTASWIREGKIYLLAGPATQAELQNWVKSSHARLWRSPPRSAAFMPLHLPNSQKLPNKM